MKTSVCTLFEGNYHFGLAALVNSLCKNDFEGTVYAGYRGELPKWARVERREGLGAFHTIFDMKVSATVTIAFVLLETEYHFTNYKPNFILEIFEIKYFESDALFYLDPDIIVNTDWESFKTWVSAGVALSEDVNSPMSLNHPVRAGWRRFFSERGVTLTPRDATYVNGGCVGVRRDDLNFIRTWKAIQEEMASAIGGLNRSSLAGAQLQKSDASVFAPFSKTDQDALNATIEASEVAVSIAGKEAMGFAGGRAILPHALGQPKPWTKKPISQSISGYPPRFVDKLYWENVETPIRIYPKYRVVAKSLAYKVAILISRFYKRN